MHLPRPAMKAMKAIKATIIGLAVAATVVQEAVPEAPARELIAARERVNLNYGWRVQQHVQAPPTACRPSTVRLTCSGRVREGCCLVAPRLVA